MPHTTDDAHSHGRELPGRRVAASPEQTETMPPDQQRLGLAERMQTLSPERLRRTRKAHRRYYRWLRLSRLALAAFVLLGAVFLVWLLPWLPAGLDTDDYTPELAFTLYLFGGVALTGILVLGLQELARRDRQTLMLWATVYDEATGLHNRMYLFDRLSLECARAERSGSVFSVIVLQIRTANSASGPPPTLSTAALHQVAEVIDRLIHPTDLVAHLSDGELAVLAIGVGREDRHPLMERLRDAVAADLPRILDTPAIIDVRRGASTYGVDGHDSGTLVQAARTAAMLGSLSRAEAA